LKKGGIELNQGWQKAFCNVPLWLDVRISTRKTTQGFIRDFDDYTSDKNSDRIYQYETPADAYHTNRKSILPRHHVSTFDEVTGLLQQAEAPFAIFECICRKKGQIGKLK